MNKRFIATSLTMIMTLGLTAAQCCSSAFAGENEPTEIISKRSEYEKHFDNGDGTYSAYINTVPIHYLDGDEWVEIDNSLITDGKGNYTNSSSALHITLPSVLSDTDDGIHLAYKGYALDVSPDSEDKDSAAIITQPEQNGSDYSQLPKAAADVFSRTVSSVKYDSVYGNNDLNIEIRPDSVIESVDFEKSEDVPEMLSFKIASEELVPEENDNNGIDIVNGSGEKVFEIPPIMIVDSSYDPTAIPVPFEITTEEDGYLVSLSPSDAIENNNDINYPLIMSMSFYTQINVQTFYNSEYYPNNTYYNNYIRFGNESGHGYQTYVSSSNLFNGFGYYGTILEAGFWMYMSFNNITEPKPCEIYSVNSQPVNCSWSNAATLNTYNTKISDFTTSAADTYLWKDVDFTKLAQSWKNYADSSYAVGVPAYGFKIVTTSSPAATVSATSERATTNHPYYYITYSISSSNTLDYAPHKYDNIICSSPLGSIYNFQNRMNCYAYALQTYYRGTLASGTSYLLKPGEFGISQNMSSPYTINNYNDLNSYYTGFNNSFYVSGITDAQRRQVCRNMMKFIEVQMDRDAATIGFNITPLKNNYNASNYVPDNTFTLPSTFDPNSERAIALIAYEYYRYYGPGWETRLLDYHYYLRNGNGTCDNPSHGSNCSKWSHKIGSGTVKDTCGNNSSIQLCDYNIGNYAYSLQYCGYNPGEVRYYIIDKHTNIYNSAHGDGHSSNSTGTPYYGT